MLSFLSKNPLGTKLVAGKSHCVRCWICLQQKFCKFLFFITVFRWYSSNRKCINQPYKCIFSASSFLFQGRVLPLLIYKKRFDRVLQPQQLAQQTCVMTAVFCFFCFSPLSAMAVNSYAVTLSIALHQQK